MEGVLGVFLGLTTSQLTWQQQALIHPKLDKIPIFNSWTETQGGRDTVPHKQQQDNQEMFPVKAQAPGAWAWHPHSENNGLQRSVFMGSVREDIWNRMSVKASYAVLPFLYTFCKLCANELVLVKWNHLSRSHTEKHWLWLKIKHVREM